MTGPRIDRQAEAAALAQAARRVLDSTDGRTVRGARLTCCAALVRAGHTQASAERLAAHAMAWAVGVAGSFKLLEAQHSAPRLG